MRTFTTCLTLLGLLGQVALAAETSTNSPPDKSSGTNDVVRAPIRITAGEAKDHIGANAIVTGDIAEVSIAERLARLNFDKPFPQQPFNAVIFGALTNLFPDLPGLKGKSVEVSGKINEYRGRPQIIINATNQLKVVEKIAQPKADAKQ